MGKVGRRVMDLSANKPEGGRWPAHLAISHELDCKDGACVPTCPAYIMDQQSGDLAGTEDGAGGASRFFYCSKPSVAEREVGCEDLSEGEEEALSAQDGPWTPRKLSKRNNIHPTVKSVDLMRWMVRLVTPPGGLVLDCFAGSGTTGMAVMLEKMDFVGIELDDKHCDIASARISAAEAGEVYAAKDGETKLREKIDPRQLSLIG
jgi:site-specific DNA-methyltransferase (adenine-specific)